MKYYILAGVILLIGAVATYVANQDPSGKRYALEAETKVRPAYFEDMKMEPDRGVELRTPASSDN